MRGKPQVLLTGATGFLGKRVVECLGGQYDFHCIARDPNRLPSNASSGILMSLACFEGHAALPDKIDAVVHLAQSTQHAEFPDGAEDVFAVNCAAQAFLLNYAASAGAKSFVHASTGSVYEPFDGVCREDRALMPTSYYACTKLAAEALVPAYRSYFAGCSLRFFFLHGPGQTGRMVSGIMLKLKSGKPIILEGDDRGHRLSLTFVDDAVTVIDQAIKGGWRGPINVASPYNTDIREISETLSRLMGVNVNWEMKFAVSPKKIVADRTILRRHIDDTNFSSLDSSLRKCCGL